MKSTFSLLFASFIFPACASEGAVSGVMQMGGATRHEVRRAVELHRASQHEEVQREEAAAGRRLTPAELSELRSQVRSQWAPRYDVPRTGASIASEPAAEPSRSRSLTLPRSQRP